MIAPALPPLTAWTALTAWRLQPGVLAAVSALGGGYGVALRRRRRVGAPWPRRRTACFGVGVAAVALVGLSFVGVYDDTLFWTRAVQNLVLVMVAPMLIALGAPVRLAADLLPPARRAAASRVLHSPAARALTFPLLATLLIVAPLLVLYLTPLYARTLDSGAVSGAVGTVLFGTAFVYFWTRFRIDPTPRADPYGVTLALTVVEVVGDAVLGLLLFFGPVIAQGHYATRGWGPSPQLDQQIGAVVLSLGGDLVGLPFLRIVFGLMSAEDSRRAADVDAALDAAEAARVTEAEGEEAADGARPRLWWEDDPQIAQRFRRR